MRIDPKTFNPNKKFPLDQCIRAFFAGYAGPLEIAGKGYDSAFVLMTPTLSLWLRNNRLLAPNRNAKQQTRERIACAVESACYFGHAPGGVAVGETNEVYDANNRINVFAETQYTGWLRFTFGVPKEMLGFMDTGDPRTDFDLEVMQGHVPRDTGKREVEVCRWISFIEKGVAPRKYTTNYADFRARFHAGLAWVTALPLEKKKQPFSPLVLAAFVYMHKAYPRETEKFYNEVASFKLSQKPMPPSKLVGLLCVDVDKWMGQNNQEARKFLYNSVIIHIDAARRDATTLAPLFQVAADREMALQVTRLPVKKQRSRSDEAKTG